jgi:hypothetical protein
MRNVFNKNQKTHFVLRDFFLNRAVYELNVERCGTPRQVTEDNSAHGHCMLDT